KSGGGWSGGGGWCGSRAKGRGNLRPPRPASGASADLARGPLMADTASEQTLMALLALDAEDSQPSGGNTRTALPLPSVEERVDLLLHAVYGPEHSCPAEE